MLSVISVSKTPTIPTSGCILGSKQRLTTLRLVLPIPVYTPFYPAQCPCRLPTATSFTFRNNPKSHFQPDRSLPERKILHPFYIYRRLLFLSSSASLSLAFAQQSPSNESNKSSRGAEAQLERRLQIYTGGLVSLCLIICAHFVLLSPLRRAPCSRIRRPRWFTPLSPFIHLLSVATAAYAFPRSH